MVILEQIIWNNKHIQLPKGPRKKEKRHLCGKKYIHFAL